eukprot:scaffold11168_cov20-Prasinocladus_malaysianus.AAC.2
MVSAASSNRASICRRPDACRVLMSDVLMMILAVVVLLVPASCGSIVSNSPLSPVGHNTHGLERQTLSRLMRAAVSWPFVCAVTLFTSSGWRTN